jgi:hypothetical protein
MSRKKTTMQKAAKFETRNSKLEIFGAPRARIRVEAPLPASGFEFRISSFEFPGGFRRRAQ